MKAVAIKNEVNWLNGLARTRLSSVDWRALAAFSLPFIVYIFTLAPTVYNLDSAELTTAAATGGLMRSTGYPLYLTLGSLWSKIPLGDVGYRMNLFSAFTGALTIFFADRTLRKLGVSGWASAGALGLLATGVIFWGMSLIAEVYTLHTALMAALIYALVCWQAQPSPLRIALVGLVAGMSLAHHAASVLLIPGALFYLLSAHRRQLFAIKMLGAALFGLLLGLSFYLYLPIRYAAQPAFNYAGTFDASLVFHPVNLQSLSGLWWLATGSTFAGQMLAYRGTELWGETWRFIQQLSGAFFAIGIGPGLLGMLTIFKRDWRTAVMLALMFAFSAGFFIDYRVIDKNTMFLPAYLVFALWVGYGYQEALDWLKKINLSQMPLRGSVILQTAMAAVVLLSLGWNWRLVDLSDDWSGRERGEAILSRVQTGALVIGWWDTVPVIQYLQLVEGQRPDVWALNRFLIAPNDLRTLIQKEVDNRPIYIDNPSKDLLQGLDSDHIGPIFQIKPPR